MSTETFIEYVKEARSRSDFADKDYPALGLFEEVGQLAGKFADAARTSDPLDSEGVISKCGDILWMIVNLGGNSDKQMGENLHLGFETWKTNPESIVGHPAVTEDPGGYIAMMFEHVSNGHCPGVFQVSLTILDAMGSSIEEAMEKNLELLKS